MNRFRFSAAPPRRRRIIYLVPNLLTALGFLCGFFSNHLLNPRRLFISCYRHLFVCLFRQHRRSRRPHEPRPAVTSGPTTIPCLICSASAWHRPCSTTSGPLPIRQPKWAGRFGWAVAFLYASCAALRLARFNVQLEKSDKRFFVGLPCPVAATFIASIQWMTVRQNLPMELWFWLALGAMFAIALLMASNLPYFSFKTLSFGPRIPFSGLILVVGAIALALFDPYLCVFVALALYTFHGFALFGWKILRRRSSRNRVAAEPKSLGMTTPTQVGGGTGSKIAMAQLNAVVGDPSANASALIKSLQQAQDDPPIDGFS